MPWGTQHEYCFLLQPHNSRRGLLVQVCSLRRHGDVSCEHHHTEQCEGLERAPGRGEDCSRCRTAGCEVPSGGESSWLRRPAPGRTESPTEVFHPVRGKAATDLEDYKHGSAGGWLCKFVGGERKGEGVLCCAAKPQRSAPGPLWMLSCRLSTSLNQS